MANGRTIIGDNGENYQQGELPPPTEIELQQWMRRRKRNTVLGLVLGLAAIVISLGYSLHNAVGRIDTSVVADMGPTTRDAPATPLGHFRQVGTALKHGNKPQVLMIGTLRCADCAAERWAMVKAMGRFGTWSNLAAGTNGAGIPTFDLVNAKYSSWYVSLDHKDTQDLDGLPLQKLTAREQTLFKRYDPQGTTPLLVVGKYAQVGQGVSPDVLANRSFRSVQTSLITNQATDFSGAINAEANLITAMLCKADGGNPSVFCSRSEIKRITLRLR